MIQFKHLHAGDSGHQVDAVVVEQKVHLRKREGLILVSKISKIVGGGLESLHFPLKITGIMTRNNLREGSEK